MAGYGFDNNADVLAITPALMARYMSAATKISRLALSSPDNRAMTQVYKVDIGSRQDQRMGEDLPFGTHGGLSARHTFPLDGEYVFRIRLVRNGTVGTIEGIDEDEHEIELRVDHALIKTFKVGGKFKGPDPGVLIAVAEDDIEGQQVHDYRLNADKELEIRVPIKAGTRLVAATFTDSLPSPLEGATRRGRRDGGAAGIDMVYVSGPFNGTAGDTPSRQKIFTCRPTSARDEEPCARKVMSTLARRAYRRPVTDADVRPLMAIYAEGRAERDFDAGIERAVEAMLSSPKFLIRIEREPATVKVGAPYRLSDMELASRLSFFLWRSIPDDELIDLAEKGRLKEPAVLVQQVKRLLADRRSTRMMEDFVGQWLQVRNIQAQAPDQSLFPDFEDTLRQAMAQETELFFESQVREDRPIQELLTANYSFLNERLARHYGIEDIYGSRFRRVNITDPRRIGPARPGEHPDGQLVRAPHLRGAARQVGAREPAGRAAAAAAAQRAAAQGERRQEQADRAARADGGPSRQPGLRVVPRADGPARLRARALRRHRQVARDRRRRRNQLDNHAGRARPWTARRPFRDALLSRSDEFIRTVTEKLLTYALGRGVDLRGRPGHPAARTRPRSERQSLVGSHSRHRQDARSSRCVGPPVPSAPRRRRASQARNSTER